jgi:hypothetical protein
LIASALLLFSCKKEKVELPVASMNYFPTEAGRYVEYEVDSVYHAENDNNNDDSVYSFHFYLKDVVDTSYSDLQGRINQVVLRYRRNETLDPWALTDVWSQYLSASSAYRNEDNVLFHKLSFPINETITWNVNDANTLVEEDAFYEYFHEADLVNGVSFDSTLSVIQIDENNYVERLYGNEKYASGVGLIYQERKNLGKKNGIVVKGLDYKMQVIGYGKQ